MPYLVHFDIILIMLDGTLILKYLEGENKNAICSLLPADSNFNMGIDLFWKIDNHSNLKCFD